MSRVLDGRYEVGAVIGRGGMATVWAGRDLLLHRTVAIKTMRPDLAQDPEFRARFLREARAVAALNHPGIVALHDAGDGGDTPYLVMEYIDGVSLAAHLADTRPTVADAVSVVAAVLGALAHSHDQGIVHRDIKPGNVMLTRSGGVKVTDFGIARPLTGTHGLTATSVVIGTAGYLSPEQVTGGPVDGRTDVYATGCLLYVLLTGATPFAGGSELTVAYRQVHEPPVAPSRHRAEVSAELDRVVLTALAKDPAERYQSADAMRAALLATGVAPPPGHAAHSPAGHPARPPAGEAARTGAGHLAGEAAATATPHSAEAPSPTPPSDPSRGRHAAPTRAFHPTRTPPDSATRVAHPAEADATSRLQRPATAVFDAGDLPGAARPRRRPRRALLAAGLCVLLVAAGLTTWALWPVGSVPVPNVIGASEADAADQLRRAGLRLGEVHHALSADADAGEVFQSDPQPGWLQDPGSTVDLYVSDGPPEPVVPAGLPGRTRDAATRALDPLKARVTVEYEPSDRPRDVVLSTHPAAGVKVNPGDEVTLVLSCGDPEECD
ncbi:Stk1 family PASTA domain-containing Ser/Thr kinase [Longispora sp. K20-0274]|uniref:Stk1 family PASTA domain-containing Ser/Thr kinase n=1 Tax=Longispora sp. K20-0274 TaxID=3088255 RepID=UPI00399B87DB